MSHLKRCLLALVLLAWLLAACTRPAASTEGQAGITAFFDEAGQATAGRSLRDAGIEIVANPLVLSPQARGRRYEGAFVIRNHSSQEAQILSLAAPCRSCRITAPVPRIIPPGGEVQIPLHASLALLEGRPARRNLLIEIHSHDRVYSQRLTAEIPAGR